MKFLVIVRTKDLFFGLQPEKQIKLLSETFDFVEKQKKAGHCKEIYYTPGDKGTASIWEAETFEELTLRFIENPMNPFQDAQIYLLSDWGAFMDTAKKIYRKMLAK
jgi:hypothetical protein